MLKENKRILWLSLRSSVELVLGVVSVCYAIVFFLNTPIVNLEPKKALTMFWFLFSLIMYFFGFGFYNIFALICLLRDRPGWRLKSRFGHNVNWDDMALVCLLVLLLVIGPVIIYSAVRDITYFFCRMDYYGTSYWESAIMSFAPATAFCFGLGITIIGGWFLTVYIKDKKF